MVLRVILQRWFVGFRYYSKRSSLNKSCETSSGFLCDVAASGGYYISVASDKIFAEPTTITGSIGVFGTIPNAHELATE